MTQIYTYKVFGHRHNEHKQCSPNKLSIIHSWKCHYHQADNKVLFTQNVSEKHFSIYKSCHLMPANVVISQTHRQAIFLLFPDNVMH
uniref:Uncharacterized protein n=1 Tax=Anguilla anguilla TaxID=7936 RepID=A0A0E9X4P1_ANGAN